MNQSPGPPQDGPAARRILVVDDEEVVRILVARALADAGFVVTEAADGAAAVALLARGGTDIDLVVCDLVMPAFNGRDLARWLARHRPELPILLISGYPLAYLEAHDLHDPGLPLLRKPFLPSKLVEAVEETLASAADRSPAAT